MIIKLANFMRKFGSDDRGITAVEFGFMAIPFAYLMIGMAEMAFMFTAGTILQGGSEDAARLIRTGQAQESGDPESMFEDLLCDKVETFIDCNELQYEVIEIEEDNFSAIEAGYYDSEFDDDGNLQGRGFSPGQQNSVVLVRVAYLYQIVTPLFGQFMSNYPGNHKLFVSTVIMQNEPYDF